MSLTFSSNTSRPSFSVAQTLTSDDSSPLSLPPTSTPMGLTLPDPRIRAGPTLGSLGTSQTWPYPPPPHPGSVFPQNVSVFSDNIGTNHHAGGPVPPNGGPSIMENWENWRQFQQAAYANNLDPHMLAFYHNTGCPMDLSNAPRRKNATRETTSMLKAWLNEHRKNPYPTKGEKIMLAIITKMTLTQVSTWFANARRRLKKENKMTWSPRNRSEEERQNDGGGVSGQRCSDDEDDDDQSINVDNDEDDIGDLDDFDTNTDDDNELHFSSVKEKIARALTLEVEEPNSHNLTPTDKLTSNSSSAFSSESQPSQPKKPKIWSLVDTASKEDPSPPKHHPTPQQSSLPVSVGPVNYLGGVGFPCHNPGMTPMCPPGLPLASLLPSNGAHMFSAAAKLFPSLLAGPPHPAVSVPHMPLHMGSTASAATTAYLQNPFLYAAGLNLHNMSTFPGRNPVHEMRDSLRMFPEHLPLYGMDPLKTVSHSPTEYSASSSPSKT